MNAMDSSLSCDANLSALIKPSLIKISSFGKGCEVILHHIKYISREGRLPLEDEKGNKINSFIECKRIIEQWSVDFSEKKRLRDTMHLMISPANILCAETLTHATRRFLAAEFKAKNYRYLFVTHLDTKQPHTHIVVKMMTSNDERIIPDKVYLHELKYRLAQVCHENERLFAKEEVVA